MRLCFDSNPLYIGDPPKIGADGFGVEGVARAGCGTWSDVSVLALPGRSELPFSMKPAPLDHLPEEGL